VSGGRYEHLTPYMRTALLRAEAARTWLTRPNVTLGIQEVHDLCAAREILQSFEIAEARVASARDSTRDIAALYSRLQSLEDEVGLLLRAQRAGPADAPSEGPGRPCGVGWPPPRVTG
jgi:hypothetical protein